MLKICQKIHIKNAKKFIKPNINQISAFNDLKFFCNYEFLNTIPNLKFRMTSVDFANRTSQGKHEFILMNYCILVEFEVLRAQRSFP